MTAKNAKIKVIKRNQVMSSVVEPKPAKAQKKNPAREMVSTVTNWVSDFQARKRDETKAAIEKFLVTKPQPSEL
ncbi:MAG TPA: hypothetical protein VMS29_02635 [Pyrinomonadaceae bacterium]|nr:hypothetical protein [Pyrinomonadaceae bacterium]